MDLRHIEAWRHHRLKNENILVRTSPDPYNADLLITEVLSRHGFDFHIKQIQPDRDKKDWSGFEIVAEDEKSADAFWDLSTTPEAMALMWFSEKPANPYAFDTFLEESAWDNQTKNRIRELYMEKAGSQTAALAFSGKDELLHYLDQTAVRVLEK